MFIFFGGGTKTKNPGGHTVPFYCSRCSQPGAFSVLENYTYGHLYGIRLAKYKAKHFLACETCDAVYPIPTVEGFRRAQQLSAQIQSTLDLGMTPDWGALLMDVAANVLSNQQLADALQSA